MTPGWARRLRATGSEPDARFTFANERTFLAWVRTALALVAAGVAVEAFVDQLLVTGLRQLIAVSLVALGALTSLSAFRRWMRTERALREGSPLPAPVLAPVLSYGVALVAVAAFVLVAVGRR